MVLRRHLVSPRLLQWPQPHWCFGSTVVLYHPSYRSPDACGNCRGGFCGSDRRDCIAPARLERAGSREEPHLRAFGAGIFIWENGLRVLHALGAYEDVLRDAHQAPAYETRRDGVCIAFEQINGGNRYRLLTMTRHHLYAAILASAQREGVELCTQSEAVGAQPEGV